MAEALATIGAVASILQLAQYSQAVVSRVVEFRSATRETPKAFRNLQIALPFITNTLVRIKARVESGDILAEAQPELRALLMHCESKVGELNLIFSKHIPPADTSRLNIYWKAILSVGQDKKVQNVSTEIMEIVKLLTLHSVTAAPTVEDISSIVTSDLATTIDHRMRNIIDELKENSSSITNFNNHSQHFVNRSNGHVYYNGQTQVTNHFYFNVTDSRALEDISTVQAVVEGGRVPKMISATPQSHPAADFMRSRQDSFAFSQAVPVASSSTTFSSRMISGPESFAFLEESEPTVWENRNFTRDLPEVKPRNLTRDLPEVVCNSPYSQQNISRGFVEAMESSTSLPEAVRSPSLSRTSMNESVRTPPSTRTVRSSRSRHSVHSVHSATSLSPPLPGYIELEAPISGIWTAQFQSPLLSPSLGRPSTATSSISEGLSDTHSSSGDISALSSDILSDSSTLADDISDNTTMIRLESANSLLRHASSNVSTSPSTSRKSYADAILQYHSLTTLNPVLEFRKYRSLISAELGLSLVVTDQYKHIDRAEIYAGSALAAACKTEDAASNISRVRLDQANIKARRARLQEKGRSSMLVLGALHVEALDLFQEVVRDLGPQCQTVDDYNAVAQALLGSARMSKRLQGWGADPRRRVMPVDVYLLEALETIRRGLRLSQPADAAAERLMETKELVQKMLGTT